MNKIFIIDGFPLIIIYYNSEIKYQFNFFEKVFTVCLSVHSLPIWIIQYILYIKILNLFYIYKYVQTYNNQKIFLY